MLSFYVVLRRKKLETVDKLGNFGAAVLGLRMGKSGRLELNQIRGIRIADCREAEEKNLYMAWSPLLGVYNSHN